MYINTKQIFIILIFLFLPISIFCFEPVLKTAVKIQANEIDLDADSYSIPRVYDWNNDGKKDLIIGHRIADKVRLYLNSGTDNMPVFTTFSNIQAGGVDIYIPGSACGAPAPEIADWNNDGKKDLLVGGSDGYTWLFLQSETSNDSDPQLLAGVKIRVNGAEFTVGIRSVPCVNDWNEDGKKDLLIGAGGGNIYVLINTGTDANPQFDDYDYVYADLAPLSVGLRASPRIIDWNGDGYKDIISGEADGRILFYENIGTNSNPDFDDAKIYLNAGGSQIDIGSRSRPVVVDWNDDGLPDILCGSSYGCVYYYEQEFIFEFECISCDPAEEIWLKWRSRLNDTYTVYYSTDMAQWDILDDSVQSQGFETIWCDITAPSQVRRLYQIKINE